MIDGAAWSYALLCAASVAMRSLPLLMEVFVKLPAQCLGVVDDVAYVVERLLVGGVLYPQLDVSVR